MTPLWCCNAAEPKATEKLFIFWPANCPTAVVLTPAAALEAKYPIDTLPWGEIGTPESPVAKAL